MTSTAQYEIEHVSRYVYSASARQCTMMLCVEPRADRGQRLLGFELETRPPASLNRDMDAFGNARHLLAVNRAHETLEIVARSKVRTPPAHAIPARAGAGAWEAIHAARGSFLDWDFTQPSALVPASSALESFVERHHIGPGDDPLESVLQLADTLYRRMHYAPGSTTAESSVDHILGSDRGVCQDYAHAMIAIARSWGIPARYVSGYLFEPNQSAQYLPGNTSHAWVECRLPGLGWIGFDPTNASLATESHVRIAIGRDYRDVSPTHGVIRGGGEPRLEIDVRMRADCDPPAHEDTPVPVPAAEVTRAADAPRFVFPSDQ